MFSFLGRRNFTMIIMSVACQIIPPPPPPEVFPVNVKHFSLEKLCSYFYTLYYEIVKLVHWITSTLEIEPLVRRRRIQLA